MSTKGRVLIVDDEANARNALAASLRGDGFEVQTASDGRHAMAVLDSFEPDVVLTDLKMPGMDGIELLKQARATTPHSAYIVLTAFGSIDSAVEAIKSGAESYLTKPVDLDAVTALVERALDRVRLSKEAARLREQVTDRYSFDQIHGDHPAMQRLLKQVAQVAPSRATVLIQGESGTGKELIASAIHHNSKRRNGPFIRLNCSSLAETLLESELFGHERGSFTGAHSRRDGRFQQADKGTLFLDEVSEIPLATQVKLLRFLQERELERVGGNETVHVDVRVVAATNRDLAAQVKEGRFREDLYYRLNVVSLEVPPLRARKSDVPLLAHAFLKKFAKENEKKVSGFKDGALRRMMAYPWPGNVRELENTIERAVVMSNEEWVDIEATQSTVNQHDEGDLSVLVPGISMQEVERITILKTLDAVSGSTAKTAEILGISRRKIQYRLKEWGIAPKDLAHD